MVRPVLLTVDDDAAVLRAVERDLRQQYGERYRILRADSGAKALAALEELQRRGDPVALLLVDQRMPRMSGVELLEQAMTLYPKAKRALLTACADTEAAIRAINAAKIDYYLVKPWEPPDQRLYPVLDDLLDDWQAGFRPPFEGVRVVGHRWSPQAHAIRDFLGRNQVPYQWLDVEADEEAERLMARAGADVDRLPLVFLQDGGVLAKPTNLELAEQIGLRTQAQQPFYDLIIAGGGPSGLAAAVYGASEGLGTVLIEREAPGGQAGQSSRIENYLGFPAGLSGSDLARRAVAQATRFGVEILTPQEISGVRVEGPYRIVTLASGAEVAGHALLVTTGVSYRKLDAPGIDRLTGCGVYYGAAMTEAISCRDQQVYIIGGANSAGQAALFFARYAATVTMLVRGDSPTRGMSKYLIDQIGETPNVRVRTRSRVVAAHGENNLEELTIAAAGGAEEVEERVPATSLFIFIGAEPRTDWLDGVVERDPRGFIPTGAELLRDGQRPPGWPLDRDPYLLETSVPGIFAAGDVRLGSVKRVASGVGEGAIAVSFIHQYLAKV